MGYISAKESGYPERVEIKGRYILPDFQENGRGKKLINQIVEYAKKMGVFEIYLQKLKGDENIESYNKQDFSVENEPDLLFGGAAYPEVLVSNKI